MEPIPIQGFLDDPLAGCKPIMLEQGNGTNMLRGLLLRLRIFHTEKKATAIGDQLVAEAPGTGINHFEYCINEVLYEIRRSTKEFSEQYETVVLNNWTKDLLKRLPEDVVLPFFVKVRENRKNRRR